MKKLMSTAILAHSFSKVYNFDNFVIDPYKGCHVKVNLDQYIKNPQLFKQHLIDFISENKIKNHTAIWIDLQQNQLSLAPYLIEQGFKMHRVAENKLQFSKWLLDGESRLPSQASHFVGVGGIVVQDGNILLVQEKNGNRRGAWGTPGGIVDQKESLVQAVIREVKEETNLNCQVQDILYYREMHDAKFGKTDLYFAFKMSCNNINEIQICQNELMDYRWVPVNELSQFLNTQNQKPHVLNFYKSVQERLQNADKNYMTITEKEEMYYDKLRYYAVFKPRF